MKKILLLLMFICVAGPVAGQTVKGTIYDAATNKPLAGTAVTYPLKGQTVGVSSERDGSYEVTVPAGSVTLTFSFLGYEPQVVQLILKDKEVQTHNIYMKQASEVLDDIVVSAGRYEQPIGEVTVSMEVIKADGIERQNSTDLRAVLNTLPGVEITDKQPSIRGGSGWNYGVGS